MAGDVVTLATGDQICSDGVLIEAQELAIDESGEISEEQFEEQKTALEEAADDSHETPLQIRLSGLATNIGKLGLGVAILVFIILMARFFVTVVRDGSTKDDAQNRS